MSPETLARAHAVAKAYHETHERLAPEYGYKMRKASVVPWDDLSEPYKLLIVSVFADLLSKGVIQDVESS